MLFLTDVGHGHCEKRQKWTRRYLLSTAVSSKKGDFNTPSVFSFLQKKTAVLIVISKPPLKWHENFLLHKRFFFMLMK